jgi:sugar phosphate isomerase/epimerase
MKNRIHRRDFLAKTALATLALGSPSALRSQPESQRSKMGLVAYVFNVHTKAAKTDKALVDLSDPLNFLEECHRLGAGGMQVPLGVRDPSYLNNLRKQAERYGMYVETMLELPRNEADLERFEKQLLAARMAGATVARTTMLPGRRYEQFETREDFERACAQGLKSVRLAEPIAARHKFRLALENHKDHLVAEKLEVLKQISSEYVGLCVDVLNNVALLEDPLETVRAFAPYAMTVHFKDESIHESEDGFWLADEALGAGFLDLPAIAGALRQAKPDVHLNLETITRDPILVPVRTEKYWATFPGRPRSAMEPMLKLAKEKGAAKQTWVSRLPLAEQLALERRNVQQSLQYAREKLAL